MYGEHLVSVEFDDAIAYLNATAGADGQGTVWVAIQVDAYNPEDLSLLASVSVGAQAPNLHRAVAAAAAWVVREFGGRGRPFGGQDAYAIRPFVAGALTVAARSALAINYGVAKPRTDVTVEG